MNGFFPAPVIDFRLNAIAGQGFPVGAPRESDLDATKNAANSAAAYFLAGPGERTS